MGERGCERRRREFDIDVMVENLEDLYLELHAATRKTIRDAIEVLRARVPPTFEQQVRGFLAVHNKGGSACPRCGTRISQVKAGGFVTSYCRGCQR